MNYKYPDTEDKLISKYIKKESSTTYWEESERNILNDIIKKIQKENKKQELLDLGCGQGRLLKVFIRFVSSIIAIEPDKDRYKEACKEAEGITSKEIKIINGTIKNINNKKIPLVLCSHVLQHIPLNEVKEIINELQNIIPENGLLFITTTFTTGEEDKFCLSYLEENKYKQKEITEKEFNNNKKENELKTRKFTYKTIETILNENNFTIEDAKCYHFDCTLNKKQSAKEFDEEMNKKQLLETAKDILYIARKKPLI